MKTTKIAALALIALALLTAPPAHAWGRKAHETIARSAVQGLPDPMKAFFVTCREYLAFHAEDPDNWREHDPAEGYRHYIDLELLPRKDWAALPPSLKEADAKYGAEKMQKVGALPWRIAEMTETLAAHMREGKWDDVKITAAALSHYVADAHQPLHCTLNYDGRGTGNDGIHGRFEIEMADRYVVTPMVPVKPAAEVKDVFAAALKVCLDSNAQLESILQADTAARAIAALDSPAYYVALTERCGDLAKRRIAAAAQMTAGLWHTAWVRAGKPELPTKRATVFIEDSASGAMETEITGPGTPHDAFADRRVGSRSDWSRGIAWTHVGIPVAQDTAAEGTAETQPSGTRIVSDMRESVMLGYSITPAVSVGLMEAAAQLAALPGVERRVVLHSDGLADERRFDPEALAKALRDAEVTVEVHATGADAVQDANLQALCKALGVGLQPVD